MPSSLSRSWRVRARADINALLMGSHSGMLWVGLKCIHDPAQDLGGDARLHERQWDFADCA